MKPYCNERLHPGDKVIIDNGRRQIEGVITGKGRVRYHVLCDDNGTEYAVSPALIKEWEKGNPAKVPAVRRRRFFGDANKVTGLKINDVVLFHRGGKAFDVIRLETVTPKLKGRLVGVEHGPLYILKEDMFVQKLDNACFQDDPT